MDAIETAQAQAQQAMADLNKLKYHERLWTLGMESNLEVAREMMPEYADLNDAELQQRLPNLLAEPPPPLQLGSPGAVPGAVPGNPPNGGPPAALGSPFGRSLTGLAPGPGKGVFGPFFNNASTVG